MADGSLNATLMPAFYLLIGFALELLLKSVCMRDGALYSDIRKMRHDLHKAYVRAMQSGKVPRYMTPLGTLVLTLNEQHKTHVFRYTPDGPELVVPPPNYCIEVLDGAIAASLP